MKFAKALFVYCCFSFSMLQNVVRAVLKIIVFNNCYPTLYLLKFLISNYFFLTHSEICMYMFYYYYEFLTYLEVE